MTPEELRKLADEAMPLTTKERNELAAHRAVHGSDTSTPRADAYDLAGEILCEMAFDLARLCAEQHALLARLRAWDIIFGPGTPEGEFTADAPYWRGELDAALAKLSELKPVT